jgi:hypothetical protein
MVRAPFFWRSILVVLSGLPFSGPIRAQDSEALIPLLPPSSNAIAIVRVADVLTTPRAVQEGWANAADERFLSGAGGIPSWVKTLAVGFLFRPSVPEEVWASAVATVPKTLTIDAISRREGRPMELLAGFQTVPGRHDAILIGFAPGLLGIRRPAIRQEVAAWCRQVEAKVAGPTSDYLALAADTPGHIVLAMDLLDTLDPKMTQMYLDANSELASIADAPQTLMTLLQTLRGATFSANVGQTTTAMVRVDFGKEVGTLGLHLKPLFIEILHDMGAAIDDFDRCDSKVDGKSLVLTATLSDESLRRIISLITTSPSPAMSMATAAASPPETSATSADPAATKKYFNMVDQFLRDLDKANRRAKDYAQTALWHENFARRIEELPTRGVDRDLVNYADDLAVKLRGLSRSLRGEQVQLNLQQGTLTYQTEFTPGWASVNVWGGIGFGQSAYNVSSNLQQVRERQAAAISAGKEQRDQIWSMIVDKRRRIVEVLREKYGPDFVR